jgi:hypothetical protein
MQVEIGKIEHQTASALENLLSAVGAAAAV